MKAIYLTGPAKSGKTALIAGLALKLQAEGQRVAYFKPVGYPGRVRHSVDEDAAYMQELLALNLQPEEICPLIAGPSYLSHRLKRAEQVGRIKEVFGRLTREADVILIEGSRNPHDLACHQLTAADLARELDVPLLFVLNVINDYYLDYAVYLCRKWQKEGQRVLGVTLNNVSRGLWAKAEGVYKPLLEELGLKWCGTIPSRPELRSPTVAEYNAELEGEVLAAPEALDRPVEDIIIGAMTGESALGYLRRAANKAVITGGDRSDIALAALETGTSVLILTGGLYPDVRVLAQAVEKNVPVILVHYDTFTAVEKLARVSRRLHPENSEQKRLLRENIENYGVWEALKNELA